MEFRKHNNIVIIGRYASYSFSHATMTKEFSILLTSSRYNIGSMIGIVLYLTYLNSNDVRKLIHMTIFRNACHVPN